MAGTDFEAEYNNRARVPEHPAVMEQWARDAAAYRAALSGQGRAELGLAYGPSPRQTIDLFGIAPQQPILVFFHGGYWQALDPSSFSHMARGMNAHGSGVAVVGYDLCPDVSVATIIEQARAACLYLARRFGQPLVVAGHSAGGHLAACMVATDWRAAARDVPADLASAGLAISGLFELEPLTHTTINDKVRLDAAAARAASPLFWPVGPEQVFDAWVGAAESAEYLRQSRTLAETWGRRGVCTRAVEIPDANHFTAIAPMADPASPMVTRLREMIDAVRRNPLR